MLTRAGPIIGATGAARLGDAADLGGSEGTQGVAAGSRRRVPLSGRPAAGAELDLLLVLGWGALASLALFFGLIAGCVGAHKGRSGAIWFILGLSADRSPSSPISRCRRGSRLGPIAR